MTQRLGGAARVAALLALLLVVAGCAIFGGTQPPSPPPVSAVYTIDFTPDATAPHGARASIVALNPSHGSVLWSHETQAVAFPPIADDTAVYCGSYADAQTNTPSTLEALDAHTGAARWTHTLHGDGVFPPVAAGTLIYVASSTFAPSANGGGSATTLVEALDRSTGAVRWHATLNGRPSPLAVSGKSIYVMTFSDSGNALVALDATSGAARWTYGGGDRTLTDAWTGNDAAPLVADGVVYVTGPVYGPQGGNQDALVAVDASSGRLRWTYATGGTASTPEIVGGVVYVSATLSTSSGAQSVVSALRPGDGTQIWRRQFAQALSAPLVVDGTGTVVLAEKGSTSDSGALALATTDGHTLWSTPVGTPIVLDGLPPPTGSGGLALLTVAGPSTTSRAATLVAVRLSDGHVLWRLDLGSYPSSPPLAAGDTIYVWTQAPNSRLIAVGASDGKLLWQHTMRP